ncbi:MAG TPA: translesion error-prone DNA polymerase V autoproteolytic subunit [Caldisericia bacterium]|nr:translesion error-prone DNA polymerase V autoproteolytic subunit [Caldisericia bacterium]HOL83323.1 translesion error-prone DNA polymerase V autoproteolytic subunit [Caldisericia bacterium]HON82693.1 translesion error-prone DNA polymerase V autoproteolytic subunit [Caldisericia bacterium]HPC57157.1 translesion error-prone DNA polymerase V autoproteolytic subunit [Caldisericia bacterium]HPP43946.1 translesion error-prone DNA polymerase V autoproteolytic subunit [Caldisericia bacterium]
MARKKKKLKLPLYSSKVSAGFPSPADDFIDKTLDLNDLVIKHPQATFFVRVSGNSMINAGIKDGDILVIDKSLEPIEGKIVIANVDGEFVLKRIRKKGGKLYLYPENSDFNPIEIKEGMECEIWGVVTYVIHTIL